MTNRHDYVAYAAGCRCDVCRAAKADYMRARRTEGRTYAQAHTRSPTGRRPTGGTAFAPGAERAIAAGVRHGTRFAYDERGCRCEPCTTARTETDRRYGTPHRKATA